VTLQRATGKSLLTRTELDRDLNNPKNPNSNLIASSEREEKVIGWQSKIFSRVSILFIFYF
jgi:hypothetical protein